VLIRGGRLVVFDRGGDIRAAQEWRNQRD
jgi:hypothetical protein